MNRRIREFAVPALVVIFCIGDAVSARAQSQLINLPQGDFSCSVQVTSHNVPPADPAHPGRKYAPIVKRIEITQVNNVRRNMFVWSDNSVSQVWSLAKEGLGVSEEIESDGTKNVHVLTAAGLDTAVPRLLLFTLRSVSWITDKALDKKSGDNTQSLHYMAKVTLFEESQVSDVASGTVKTPAVHGVFQAWIDPVTLLPQKFDDGDALYVLSFSKSPPAGPLAMPPEMQEELNRWQEALAPHPHL